MKKNNKTENIEQKETNEGMNPAQEPAAEKAQTPEEEAAAKYSQEPEEKPQEPDKAAEYLALAQRVQADFDNFRKRNASVRADAFADGKADAVKAFLPVMDNLERAFATEKANGAEGSLLDGLELVLKQMQKMLSELGVEEILAQGQAFDPTLHNAVMQSPAAEGEEKNTVAEVFAKGYRLGDKVLRYSMVRVTI